MDYIIVGGGISGLYSAYSLHKKFGINNITILEKNNKLGGRIETFYVDGTFLEMGAGGVIDNQKNMMELIKDLGLEDKLVNSINDRSFVVAESVPTLNYTDELGNIVPFIYKINNIIPINETDFYNILHALTDRLNNMDFYQMALTYNLYMLIEKFYGFEKANQLMYQFGYHGDFYEQNAVEALMMFQREFSENAKFYRIDGGMIQIIERLADFLERKNIKIRLNNKCIDIINNSGKYLCLLENGEKMEAKNIIFAIPKMDIMKINYFANIMEKLNSVIHKPLIRIYAFFPKINGKNWFENINTVLTTRTLMSQIVPIDKERGILMIYCDTLNAKSWNYFHKKNILKRELMYNLTKLFSNIIIPEPDQIYMCYHDTGTHIWKPSIDPAEIYKNIIQPIKGENIYIVGETYSLNQQWSEGAIQSVKYLIYKLEENNSKY